MPNIVDIVYCLDMANSWFCCGHHHSFDTASSAVMRNVLLISVKRTPNVKVACSLRCRRRLLTAEESSASETFFGQTIENSVRVTAPTGMFESESLASSALPMASGESHSKQMVAVGASLQARQMSLTSTWM